MHKNYSSRFITAQEVSDGLKAQGYAHTEPVYQLQAGGTVRIPAIGKAANNDGVKVTIFDDGLGAYFTDYVSGNAGPIWPENQPVLTRAEVAERYQQAEERKKNVQAQREVEQANAAIVAHERWGNAGKVGEHDYIKEKQLKSLYNARICTTGSLLIPMSLAGRGLVNLQTILPDGNKRFLRGGKVKGCFSVVGNLSGAKIVMIAEGWATACSLFEEYETPVVVAFNAGNLMAVAQLMRSKFEDIVIAADDDRLNPVNTGRLKAIEAAQATGATLLFPELCKGCACTDFNDVARCSRSQRNG